MPKKSNKAKFEVTFFGCTFNKNLKTFQPQSLLIRNPIKSNLFATNATEKQRGFSGIAWVPGKIKL